VGLPNRWLLNHFTSLELACLVVGGALLVSAGGFLLVRRLVPIERRLENNEVAGVLLGLLGAFYGIVLGFVIVVLFEGFRAADQSVKDETTALAQVYRATDLFPHAARLRVGRDVAQYALVVRDEEWPLMRNGNESQRAHDLLGSLYKDVESVTPHGEDQKIFYMQAVDRLGALVAARRTRLNASVETLPGVFQALLLGGGTVLVLFLYFFGMNNFRAHLVMVVGVTAVLAFSLLLVIMLAYPFSGSVAVSDEPFRLGVLGQLDPHTGQLMTRLCDNCITAAKP
jgi:hypothetical protein